MLNKESFEYAILYREHQLLWREYCAIEQTKENANLINQILSDMSKIEVVLKSAK
jgi:hypothetical protein